ncbi:hypothetical protein KUTeg_023924, partial [Tegillarca granosa]
MSSLHTCATVHYKRVKFNFLITLTMGTLINQSQMGDLENGLKDLKRSRLMNVQDNFLPQSAGKMEFTADDFVSPYADGPEPEEGEESLTIEIEILILHQGLGIQGIIN